MELKFGDFMRKLEYGKSIMLTDSQTGQVILHDGFGAKNINVFAEYADFNVEAIITSNDDCDIEFVLTDALDKKIGRELIPYIKQMMRDCYEQTGCYPNIEDFTLALQAEDCPVHIDLDRLIMFLIQRV